MQATLKVILVFAVLLWTRETSLAQVGSAFDPNCYFPQLGDPTQLDTIYGSLNDQQLGYGVMNLGPRRGQTYGDVLVWGLPQAPTKYAAVKTGPGFDIRNPSISKLTDLNRFRILAKGKFRAGNYVDLLVESGIGYSIVWEDDEGNYDFDRKSILKTNQLGNMGGTIEMVPYVAELSGDDMLDIVTMATTRWIDSTGHGDLWKERVYLLYWRGGESLNGTNGGVFPDEVFLHDSVMPETDYRRFPLQADWRGVGREDLITYDKSDLALNS